jgi:uncharacterized sporulation protein YeaH/YhbH (DUF444 family)
MALVWKCDRCRRTSDAGNIVEQAGLAVFSPEVRDEVDRLLDVPRLPGVPLESGFDYRPRTSADDLSPEAQARVFAVMDEVDRKVGRIRGI